MEVCHIETLGERIRKLRKQQKLTLEALAGNELTKGMLSLIENNKANPSMESLTYIARRLGVETSELLVEVSTQKLREVLEGVERLYGTDPDMRTDEFKQIIIVVEPYLPNLTQGYESARLLEIYSYCLYIEKKKNWKMFSELAATIYEQMNMISKRANIGIFWASIEFTAHNYDKALTTLLEERFKIEVNNALLDPITQIDLDYNESALHFAAGDVEAAMKVMHRTIEFSKKKQVFYRTNELYRLATINAVMHHDDEHYNYYRKKLVQYGDFAEDKDAKFFANLVEVHYLNSIKKDFNKAYKLLDSILKQMDYSKEYKPFIHLEKGKSLYGMGQYEEAITFLEKVTIADYIHHPLDLSAFYEGDAYHALCALKTGNLTEAKRLIEMAVSNISPMLHTPYKDFIMDTQIFIATKNPQ